MIKNDLVLDVEDDPFADIILDDEEDEEEEWESDEEDDCEGDGT